MKIYHIQYPTTQTAIIYVEFSPTTQNPNIGRIISAGLSWNFHGTENRTNDAKWLWWSINVCEDKIIIIDHATTLA